MTLEAARNDDSVRGCVLTGAGDVFCLGGDYQGAGPTTAGREAYAAALLRMDRAMAALGKPLVAAVNGDAHAGGLQRRRRVRSRGRRRRSDVRAAGGRARLVPVHRTRDRQGRAAEEGVVRSRLLGAPHGLGRGVVAAPRQRGRRRAKPSARARRRARASAAAHRGPIVALGRDLYYAMRGRDPDESLEHAERALLAALELTNDAEAIVSRQNQPAAKIISILTSS